MSIECASLLAIAVLSLTESLSLPDIPKAARSESPTEPYAEFVDNLQRRRKNSTHPYCKAVFLTESTEVFRQRDVAIFF